jgi:glycosyltransferase involved in cell wall biosynthesis
VRPAEPPLRIATLYRSRTYTEFRPTAMNLVRWLRISEGLARLGHRVDMIVNLEGDAEPSRPNLRFVAYRDVDWDRYDVVKTVFHKGFDSLCAAGGEGHPFIISKLGSVVGPRDGIPGVHFFGEERERLFATQERIERTSRHVSLLTEPSRALWQQTFGPCDNLLLVPTGVDRVLPPVRHNPFAPWPERIALYAGNLYLEEQADINRLWQERLNALGSRLRRRGIRLCFVGPGRTHLLDPRAVTHLGEVDNRRIWDYQRFAHVGIVLAQGEVQHNESSKIYYYLRSGLPVVSESPVPNNHLIESTAHGFVAPYADDDAMAEMVDEATRRSWDRDAAGRYLVAHHTWDHRVRIYDELLRRESCRSATS